MAKGTFMLMFEEQLALIKVKLDVKKSIRNFKVLEEGASDFAL